MRRTDQSAAVVGSTIYGDGVFLILVGSWRGASKNRDYAASRRNVREACRGRSTCGKHTSKNETKKQTTVKRNHRYFFIHVTYLARRVLIGPALRTSCSPTAV